MARLARTADPDREPAREIQKTIISRGLLEEYALER